MDKDIKFFACVDVGTVGTAIVWGVVRDLRNARAVDFPKPSGINYAKVPSKVVLTASTNPNEREVIAVGYEAEDLFAERAADTPEGGESDNSDDEETNDQAEHQDIMFFSNFKQSIIDAVTNPFAHGFENGIVNFDEVMVMSDNKWKPEDNSETVQVPLKEVVSKFIRAVTDVAVAEMAKALPTKFDQTHIQWIFTTPEIWDEYTKTMMLECAREAHLTHCQIASEASCAAAWFLHEREKEIAEHKTDDDIPLARRTRYLLFDIGGGTTDCVYHEINEVIASNANGGDDNKAMDDGDNSRIAFRVSEKFPSITTAAGALWIEQDFVQMFLRTMFGDNFDTMCSQKPHLYIALMRNFFVAKTMMTPSKAKRNLKVPSDAARFLDGSIDDINARLSAYPDNGGTVDIGKYNKSRGMLSIKLAGWKLLHRRLFTELERFIVDQLNFCENREVVRPRRRGLQDYVVFCGGFSKSMFLQEFVGELIERHFPNFGDVHFLKLASGNAVVGNFFAHPEQAVALGGLYPRSVCKFMSPAYYGFQFNSPYNPLCDPDPDHVRGDMEVDCFQLIVSKYQSYEPGHRVDFNSFHPSPGVDSVTINVYKCDRDVSRGVPRYVDEEGCRLAMSFDVPIKPNAQSTKVQAVLQPGSLELCVIVDQEEVPCQLRLA